MKRIYAVVLLLGFVLNVSSAQDEKRLYEKMFSISDSLINIGEIQTFDTSVYTKAKELDKQHPLGYFEETAMLLSQYKYNEASFLFYLGTLRYKQYNFLNPDYEASEDGALLSSISYVLGEPINVYLKTDFDNNVSNFERLAEYYKSNRSTFFTDVKNDERYESQIRGVKEMVEDYKLNREKYTEEWKEETTKLKESIKNW